MNTIKPKVIELISKTYTAPYKKEYISCRAIIIENNKILLSHESKTGFYMSPGGGVEKDEAYEECVTREIMEETGYEVTPVEHIFTVNEYCYETLYISEYFICKIAGKGEQKLTETEIFKGMEPRWVELSDALEIFGDYATKTPDKESLYRREYTIINEYMNGEMK